MKRIGQYTLWIWLVSGLIIAGKSAAVEIRYGLSQLQQDTLGRRAMMPLDGVWTMQIGGSGEWQGFQLPAPLRLRDQFMFVRRFSLDSSMIANAYELAFNGIDGSSTIYLNKKIIAIHSAGTAPLTVTLSDKDLFVNAENELVVQMDCRLDYRRSVPLLVRNRGIPLSGNGLFRPVVLRKGATPFVAAITLTPGESAGFGSLDIAVRATVLLGKPDSLTLAALSKLRGAVEILDSQTALPVYTSPLLPLNPASSDTATLQAPAVIPDFHFWRPGAPERYRVVVQLLEGGVVVDRASVYFALSQPRQWLEASRGKSGGFRYRAVEWVEDATHVLLTPAQQEQQIAQDLQGITELGANTVRLPGGIPGESFLRRCDSLGLAVMAEIPMANIPSAHLDNDVIRMKAKKALTDLILAFRDHPCIAAWGLGTGYNPGDRQAETFLREFAAIARTLDSRPVYAGVRGRNRNTGSLPVDLEIVEVPPEKIATFKAGSWRAPGSYLLQFASPMTIRSANDRSAQQNQAYYLKMAILETERLGEAAGLLVTPWRDWSGESPHTYWGPRLNSPLYLCGLLDAAGQQRLAWQVTKAAFTGTAMPELLPADLTVDDPAVFQIVSIALIVLLLFYIRRDKRMSHYLHRVFVYPHGFYMDLIENRQVNPFLTGVVGLASFLTMSTLLASLVFFLRENSLFDEILTWFFPGATAKDQAILLIWHPERMIFVFTGLMIGIALLQSLVYKMVVFGQHRYLRFSQIVTFTFWVPANFIFALPLAVVLFRILTQSNLVMAALIYFVLILVWFFLRALRGTRVILQISFLKTLLVVIAAAGIIALVIGLYLEQSRAMLAYAAYYRALLGL
ncbi:MAG TPA: hypothetical protein PLG50_00300 [bacterium]|nr:hypothetical protein [bacterium]HQG44080.1 hypothetical protein [bacterium]HQJ63215.1 hypothetical protein [bacterium]